MQKIQERVSVNKTALVVGATGFIGKFLIARLLQEGFTVFAMCRNVGRQAQQLNQWLHTRQVNSDQLSFVQGDVTLPNLGLSDADWLALKDVQFLFNTSALFAWNLSAQQARAVNVDGLTNLLGCINQHCSLQRAIHLSGYMLTLKEHLHESGIDLNQVSRTNWSRVYKTLGAYEASKIEGHFTWIQQAHLHDMEWTVIHPATVIGDEISGEIPSNQPIDQFVRQLITGKMTAIPATPQHYLPLVSINMLVSAIVYAVQDENTVNQELLVANPQQIKLQKMVEIVADQLKIKPPTRFVPLSFLKLILKWTWLANQLGLSAESLNFLRTEKLGLEIFEQLNQKWEIPETDLVQTLERTTLWVAKH